MRKSSSFMCVLVVLLAGGAEAQRPIVTEKIFGLAVLGIQGVGAWTMQAGCRPMSEIYTNGEDLVDRMWGNAFEVQTPGNESRAYTMWWFEGGQAGSGDASTNPNDAITQTLGMSVPNQCHLDYYHKDAPSPEGADFTECHPWHANSCCHQATVVSPEALRASYGPGYEWDRCGPLSAACERFFVMEGCFYECEVNAGLYRKYTDAQHAACSADGVAEGATVILADNSSYTCQVGAWGGNDENKWQLHKMPIRKSFADAWYRACANDNFCGNGDFFECAGDYHAQLANDTYWAERRANETLAAMLAANEGALPNYALAIIVVVAVLALVFFLCIVVMACKEKSGSPVFTDMKKAAATGAELTGAATGAAA